MQSSLLPERSTEATSNGAVNADRRIYRAAAATPRDARPLKETGVSVEKNLSGTNAVSLCEAVADLFVYAPGVEVEYQ